MTRVTVWFLAAVMLVVVGAAIRAEPNVADPPEGPQVFETDALKIRVAPFVRGLLHPWSLAFLPDGSALVTERPGRLRIIRNAVLDPTPISGVPTALTTGVEGLMGLALHPKFTENKLVYLTYTKPGPDGLSATALARGRLEGNTLSELRDIFVTAPWAKPTGATGSMILFAPDGTLIMTVGGAVNATSTGQRAQDPADYAGKVLRLRDDGTVPPDNPFVGKAGYKPEIYTMGHRNQLGLTIHPETGALWESENGPQGGDEVNILLPGKNYGWPIATFGREYSGAAISETPVRREMEPSRLFWMPSIGAAGMTFYTGDRFKAWKGNLLLAGLSARAIYRVKFNKDGFEEAVRPREALLTELRQRIRDVKQGPDGLLYVLTDGYILRDEKEGVILRIEPVE
jgi:glucose/arabinose dehydrogenase